MLGSEAEVGALAEARGWELRAGTVWFTPSARPPPTAATDIPSMQVITQALGYAKELERIV